MTAPAGGLLAGTRVLDLSTFSPVRFGTMVLADLGADVIQVDRPSSAFRQDIPLLTSTEHPRWVWHSRNKRSLGLDLRVPAAKDVLLRLVRDVDVVIEGFAVGVATKLGIDHAALSSVKPDLVYASVTGFGQTGPHAGLPGHEMNYQAMGGVTASMAAAGGEAALLPFPIADSVASLYATIAVLSGLRHRDRTGAGVYLDISIQDALVSMLGYPAQYYWRQGIEDPTDIDEFGASPTSSPYSTADGTAVVLGAVEPWVWERFCTFVQRPDLLDVGSDKAAREATRDQLRSIFLQRTREEWMAASAEHDLALTAVLTLPEILVDEHIRQRGLVSDVAHPTLGKVLQVGTPVHVDGEPLSHRGFAVPGSDTAQVLSELGVDDEELEALRRAGAVFESP